MTPRWSPTTPPAAFYATRFWWVLGYYGHTNVKVLNGGWKKWFGEGRPVSLDSPKIPEASFTVRQDPSMVCTLDHGVSCFGDADTIFLDVRSDGEWDGTNDRGNKRAGHIPGAVHLEWLNFVTDDRHQTFKPAHEVRAMLAERGRHAGQADHNLLTGRYPCGARSICLDHAGLRPSAQLRRLHGRVGQP